MIASLIRELIILLVVVYNHSKSELILLGSRQTLSKVDTTRIQVRVAKSGNLGVIFDNHMSFNYRICHVSRLTSFVRKYLSQKATEQLVPALISLRLDFCNSLFVSLSQQQLNKLQRLQNSAARLVTLTEKYSHITPVLKSLHWLCLLRSASLSKFCSWFTTQSMAPHQSICIIQYRHTILHAD